MGTSVIKYDPENKQQEFQVIARRIDNRKLVIGWVVVEQPWYTPKSAWTYYIFYNEYGSGGICGGATDLGLTKVIVDPETIRPYTQIAQIHYDLSIGLDVRLVNNITDEQAVAVIKSKKDIPYHLWKNCDGE